MKFIINFVADRSKYRSETRGKHSNYQSQKIFWESPNRVSPHAVKSMCPAGFPFIGGLKNVWSHADYSNSANESLSFSKNGLRVVRLGAITNNGVEKSAGNVSRLYPATSKLNVALITFLHRP